MFTTSFGQFVPCSIATYKKLKKIRNLIGRVDAWAYRWDRSHRKLPKNRYYTWAKKRHMVDDSWVMPSLWTIQGESIVQTPLAVKYWESYESARHPKATVEEVKPMTISEEEIDILLHEIENFLARMPKRKIVL